MAEVRQLGNTDIHITPVGLGAWAIGGDWAWGWGPQDDKQSIATIHHALDMGINWIDTAAVYGVGHSEQVVGEAIKGLSEKPYVFTKCGQVWNGPDDTFARLKAGSLRKEVEDSLRRLQVDVIDLYQVHWPEPDEDIEEAWETLAAFKEEGKVRWIGVSNYSVSQMERIKAIAPISSLQPPYSAIHRDVEDEILPYCLDNNIGVIAYSPMASGLLTGKISKERLQNMADTDWRKRDEDFTEPNLSKNLALADLFGEIAAENGVTTPVVAIAWTLRRPEVTGAIVGLRRPEQVDGVIGAQDFRLGQADISRIDTFIAQKM